jgi:hypothetical protein
MTAITAGRVMGGSRAEQTAANILLSPSGVQVSVPDSAVNHALELVYGWLKLCH